MEYTPCKDCVQGLNPTTRELCQSCKGTSEIPLDSVLLVNDPPMEEDIQEAPQEAAPEKVEETPTEVTAPEVETPEAPVEVPAK